MRLIDAERLKDVMIVTLENIKQKPQNEQSKANIVSAFRIVGLMVDDAPTIDAEPIRHGHWVKNDEGDFHCSLCNAIVESDEKSRHFWGYCYCCGAKMYEVTE